MVKVWLGNQNKKAEKVPRAMLHANHVNVNMSRHVSIPWLKSVLKQKKWLKKCHAPISHDKHVNENMSNMSCHVRVCGGGNVEMDTLHRGKDTGP